MAERFNGPYKVGKVGHSHPTAEDMEPGMVYFTHIEDTPFNREHNPQCFDGAPIIRNAAFLCPCGDHSVDIWLYGHNGLPHDYFGNQPAWQYEIHDDGTVSFSPSLHRTAEPFCHYFINNGMVQWC